jgi:putative ABC transport system permease protein
MWLIDVIRYRLRVLLRPNAHARELDEEIRFHLSLEAMQREHAARGSLASADAGWAARRRFGNITTTKEEARQMAGLGFFDTTEQDVRFALRSFRRAPGFTVVAVLTLAVGIGANTAIFSAVNAMLLRPLPFREPERLMEVSLTVPARGDAPARDDAPWSYPKFAVFKRAQTVFEDVTAWMAFEATVRVGADAERSSFEFTDSRYLPTLGLRPALGRNFSADEDATPGGPRVVMLSDALWQRRFNADSSVLGRAIVVNGNPYTIVGVLPAGFRGVSGRADLLLAFMSQEVDQLTQPWSHAYSVIARLKPGVTPERAKIAVRQLGGVVADAYPHPELKKERWGAIGRELDGTRVDPVVRRSLFVLLGAVGLVLLIACANVANLFLVRAAGRRREIAVRLAVGAGRKRLVRQLLTESIVLSILGGVASVVVAWWGVKLLAALNPSMSLRVERLGGIGAVSFDSIRLDLPAFAFAAALTIVTGLIFGLVPALQTTHPSLTGALRNDSDVSRVSGVRGLTSRNLLAIAEIALAVVLLAGSGLMLRSLGKLLGVNPGFESQGVLTMRFNVNDVSSDSLPGYYDRLLERLGSIPGVSGVGFLDCPPLNGGCSETVLAQRDRPEVAPGSEPSVGVHWVTPDWFPTLRVPLQRGRLFTNGDRRGTQKVVVISETAARKYWPGQDPIGRPVSVGQGGFWNDTAYVVGVVGDVRFGTLDSLPKPDVYLSYYQSPRGRMMMFLRTAGDPASLTPAARREIATLAPGVPLYDVRPMATRVADAMAYARFSALLLAAFGAVALALAALGTYGVISFGVSQRRKELGIRVALGATRGDVLRLVVGQGVGLAVVGGVLGLAGAFAATRVLASLLYGVTPSDPVTLASIVALLVGAVIVASWIPARRAASVHPAEALRG